MDKVLKFLRNLPQIFEIIVNQCMFESIAVNGTAKCAKNGNSRKPVGIVLFRLKTAYFNVSDDSGRCALILTKIGSPAPCH